MLFTTIGYRSSKTQTYYYDLSIIMTCILDPERFLRRYTKTFYLEQNDYLTTLFVFTPCLSHIRYR